jgi:dynein heavy chain
VNIIIQLTKVLDSLFLPFVNNEKKGQLQLTSEFIHASFLQAMTWSFGACLKQEDRILFDAFVKYLSGLSTVSIGSKTKSGQLPNEKPLLFDHVFQPELDQWIKWDDLIPKYEHDRSKRFSELFVPTVDTVRLGMMIKHISSLDLFRERFNR